ncbi:MAG TPA: hypothetical protein VE422_23380 [Terriglobia bacterium]|nr:hypothetical protein [Terriglobia bacterium]
MTPERWQHIKALFQAALEIEESQRKAFIDRACNGDSSLQQEIESLLRSYNQTSQFMEPPSADEEYGLAGQSIGRRSIHRSL